MLIQLFVPLLFPFQDYDPYEENPGSAPFSEPETQIMRKICASFEPHVWVNVHSGMEASMLLLVCLAAVCISELFCIYKGYHLQAFPMTHFKI